MKQVHATTHEWWKDQTASEDQAAFTRSYRSSQREVHAAGWRRNALLGVLAVAVPVLLYMVRSL